MTRCREEATTPIKTLTRHAFYTYTIKALQIRNKFNYKITYQIPKAIKIRTHGDKIHINSTF